MSTYRRGRSEVTVGVYAMASVVVFALMFGTLTSRGLIRKTTDLYIRFTAADGLLKGDAVLFRGVPVGEVRSIEFAPSGEVIVRAKLHRSVPLTGTAAAALSPVDMFGRQAVELRKGAGSGPELADGDTLRGVRPPGLTDRIDGVSRQVERIVADSTIELVRSALAGLGGAGDGLSVAGREASAFLSRQSRGLDDVTAAATVVLRNMAAVTDSTELVAARGDLQTAIAALGRAAARMDSASTLAVRMLDRAERGEGALGRALADPALYDRATGAVHELELLLADVRANPSRYLTVRVF